MCVAVDAGRHPWEGAQWQSHGPAPTGAIRRRETLQNTHIEDESI